MTSAQLATMSTGLWVVATVSLFILLAGWSSGETWGVTASIVRGVRGWAEHDHRSPTVTSPFAEPRLPFLDPARPIGGVAARRLPLVVAEPPSARWFDGQPTDVDAPPTAEIVDLGEHRLPG